MVKDQVLYRGLLFVSSNRQKVCEIHKCLVLAKTKNNNNQTPPQKNKETTVCYAERIQMIILSVDRVTLIFFGFSRFF